MWDEYGYLWDSAVLSRQYLTLTQKCIDHWCWSHSVNLLCVLRAAWLQGKLRQSQSGQRRITIKIRKHCRLPSTETQADRLQNSTPLLHHSKHASKWSSLRQLGRHLAKLKEPDESLPTLKKDQTRVLQCQLSPQVRPHRRTTQKQAKSPRDDPQRNRHAPLAGHRAKQALLPRQAPPSIVIHLAVQQTQAGVESKLIPFYLSDYNIWNKMQA